MIQVPEGNPPTPSEFLDAAFYWLRHWWNAPREKSKAADWAMVGLTVLIAAAAFWTAFIFEDQLSLMRDADRPWIEVDVSINSPLTYDSTGMHAAFAFVPKNIGPSPAQNISIAPTLTPAFMGDDLRQIQKRICENRAAQGEDATLRYMLFPGDHYTQVIGMGMSAEDVNSRWNKFELSSGPIDIIPIALVGCVDYTYELSPRHHQTGFALDVLMKDGRLVLKSQAPLAPESLILRSHPSGGHFAN
jgi:hypothetical protein